MNQMSKLFEYQNNAVRVAVKNNEPWFVAKDVCKILDIGKYRDAISRLSDSQRGSVVVDTLGGNQEMAVVSEAGLYKLVFTSRKPEAEKFTDWLAEEVLPSIRKHGMYAEDELINNPDLFIKVLKELKEEREEKQKLKYQVNTLEKTKSYISRTREASAMNKASQLTKQIKKLTDNEKKEGEYTATEVAIKLGIYSKASKPHAQLVNAYLNTLEDKETYFRPIKVRLETGQIVDVIYYNEAFVERLDEFLHELSDESFCFNGRTYKFDILLR